MDRYKKTADVAGDSPPREAWLFAQAILGKPIPNPYAAARRAREEREQLERLAQISPRHTAELRKLQSSDAEARRSRESLVWAAGISTEAEAKLRKLLREEAEAQTAQQCWERYYEDHSARIAEWNLDQPRQPKGQPEGGQWVAKGASGRGTDRSGNSDRSDTGGFDATSDMLELAHVWWQTKGALDQARRDLEELPRRIASEQAKLASHDGHSNVHAQNLAKAQRDLDHAKALAPELEKQLHDLEQQYHKSGYDDVPYSTWTPGETLIGGRGIEEVGRAVAMGGTPAGLKPTGIEFDIVSAALAGPAILRLGKAVLGKAAAAAGRKLAAQPVRMKPYGVGGGHHVPAKSAFRSAASYNENAALAVPLEELDRLGVMHSAITGSQQTLYREFAKTGAKLTWNDVERIEVEALVRAGVHSSVARATVRHAVDALKEAGVANPTRIPWGR